MQHFHLALWFTHCVHRLTNGIPTPRVKTLGNFDLPLQGEYFLASLAAFPSSYGKIER
jgi:hypothetical protein